MLELDKSIRTKEQQIELIEELEKIPGLRRKETLERARSRSPELLECLKDLVFLVEAMENGTWYETWKKAKKLIDELEGR